MNGTNYLDIVSFESFNGAKPKLEVGVDGVLDHHGDARALQGLCNFLNCKRIYSRARANPDHIELMRNSCSDVFGSSYFSADFKTKACAHFLEPLQAFVADAFKSAWLGAGFPDPGSKIRKRKALETFRCF